SLVAQKRYSAAIDTLRGIATKHPDLLSVQFQIASLLARTGRTDEAIKAFTAVGAERPDAVEVPLQLAVVMLHAHRDDDAAMQADRAVALAETQMDPRLKAAAHEIAARVALAREDAAAAQMHAAEAQHADPH